jgi:hypothetical protein
MASILNFLVPVSQDADEHARADTQRNQRLFGWADAVLKKLGLTKATAAASSIEELRDIPFNEDRTERRWTDAINRSVSSTPRPRCEFPHDAGR